MQIRSSQKRNSPTQRGFTLIEITIAISILAVMFILNYQIIKGLIESKVEIDDKREAIFIANSVITRLTKELQLAVAKPKLGPSCESPTGPASPYSLLGEDGSSSQSGKGTSITFTAKEAGQFIPGGTTHSGAVQISYRVEPDPDKKGDKNAPLLLIREEIPNRPPYDAACKDVIRFPISNSIVNLEFKYYDKASGWENNWTGGRANNLPEIIQFSITLKSPRGALATYTSAVKLTAAKPSRGGINPAQ